jgi:ankyrin repeat protein
MSQLSGIRDVDREILGKLDDKSLLIACSVDKYTWNTICDDNFLKRRLLSKYPQIEIYKLKNETWKHFFLRATHYIALLKEKWGYDYTFGDFIKQLIILNRYKNKEKYINNLLWESAEEGELALVISSLKKGADIHSQDDYAFRIASQFGNLEVAKYLLENGADIHARDDYALKTTSYNGDLETVKFLVEHGADIHAQGDYALKLAIEYKRTEVEKYLKSKM